MERKTTLTPNVMIFWLKKVKFFVKKNLFFSSKYVKLIKFYESVTRLAKGNSWLVKSE